jgi:hypothetical protein
MLAIAISVAVGVSVIVAIVLIDPRTQRLRRLDERRIADLRMLQQRIVVYRERHDRLPDDFDELSSEPGLGRLPLDPETGAAYGYERRDADSYRLCATFRFETRDDDPHGLPQELRWGHGAGRFCFDRRLRKNGHEDI